MTSFSAAFLFVAACGTAVPSATDVLPMLQGGDVVAASDRLSDAVTDRLDQWVRTDRTCVADAYGGLQVVAKVRSRGGSDTVLATYSQGTFVLNANGARIASTTGFPCVGSQVGLVGMKVVAIEDNMPFIAVAATRGGWRENSTSLELFAVGKSDQLDQLFVAEVGRHDEQGEHAGSVTLFAHGLLYLSPDPGMSVWSLDRATRRYTMAVSLVRPSAAATSAMPVD